MGRKSDAHGGNGDVFFDYENQTATKRLRNTSTSEKISRYKREVEVMELLRERHIPNIVEVLSVKVDEEHPQNSEIVMKKYDGNLEELISYTAGNVKLTLKLLLPVIKALKELSENNPPIYHRDLKPENILYKKTGDDYELYIADFGICFLKDNNERITEEITAIGARMFIAPEYEIGRVENVNEKGDIFSVGKLIWWMINGIKNALLPSNFWFVDEFDLTKRFPDNSDIVAASVIIASCLKINPEERCDYNKLIAMINAILDERTRSKDAKRQYIIELSMEKKKMQFFEKLKYNKQLVNMFSIAFLRALDAVNSRYPTVSFLQTLKEEYSRKSKDGVNFTSKNVDDDAAHYLYSKNFDDIYIPIYYVPASKGEIYANVVVEYNVRSSGKRERIKIEYDPHGMIVANYKNSQVAFTTSILEDFFEDLISNYFDEE